MAKKTKTGFLRRIRDPQARAMIKDLVRQERDARAERRRQLSNGLSRALLHLTDAEMSAIEPVLHGAIGRSIMSR